MNRVLLDTHVFVWALASPERLGPTAWKVLEDPSMDLALSVVSAWELAIKSARGKIDLPGGVRGFVAEGCRRAGVTLLGVDLAHVAKVAELPDHHRDPFDRLLVATALTESMMLMSYDRALDAYEVRRAG